MIIVFQVVCCELSRVFSIGSCHALSFTQPTQNKKEIYQSQKKTGLLSTIYGVIFSIERNLHSLVLLHDNPTDTQTYLNTKYSNITTESVQKTENNLKHYIILK